VKGKLIRCSYRGASKGRSSAQIGQLHSQLLGALFILSDQDIGRPCTAVDHTGGVRGRPRRGGKDKRPVSSRASGVIGFIRA
jgi:hypothetical protein